MFKFPWTKKREAREAAELEGARLRQIDIDARRALARRRLSGVSAPPDSSPVTAWGAPVAEAIAPNSICMADTPEPARYSGAGGAFDGGGASGDWSSGGSSSSSDSSSSSSDSGSSSSDSGSSSSGD